MATIKPAGKLTSWDHTSPFEGEKGKQIGHNRAPEWKHPEYPDSSNQTLSGNSKSTNKTELTTDKAIQRKESGTKMKDSLQPGSKSKQGFKPSTQITR